MTDYGTITPPPARPAPALVSGYDTNMVLNAYAATQVIGTTTVVPILNGSYLLAGTGGGDEILPRVQWLPRGDWGRGKAPG